MWMVESDSSVLEVFIFNTVTAVWLIRFVRSHFNLSPPCQSTTISGSYYVIDDSILTIVR